MEAPRHRAHKDELTTAQRKRFENLIHRIEKKIRDTFGGTLEYINVEEIEELDDGKHVAAKIKVISRGVTFGFGITARRFDDDLDAADLEGTDEAA